MKRRKAKNKRKGIDQQHVLFLLLLFVSTVGLFDDTFTPSASPICTLETIHVTETPILVLDAPRQVNLVLMMHALVVFQLGVQHRFTVRAVPTEINLGCVLLACYKDAIQIELGISSFKLIPRWWR